MLDLTLIARLKTEHCYQSVDIVSSLPSKGMSTKSKTDGGRL